MDPRDQCTEEQAIFLAGVSARTLQRFCESGYLSVSKGTDGTPIYLRSQIKEIFGCSDDGVELSDESEVPDTYYSEVNSVHATETATSSLATPKPSTERGNDTLSKVTQEPEIPTFAAAERQRMEIEIERLKNLLSIQERMLDAKDDEIADFKNQRAWLRQRVEKLEEKSDRDQILLLSETQTIRSLLAYQESRKSTFKQFLEWLGVAPKSELAVLGQPQPQTGQHTSSGSGKTIEVRRAANAD